MKYAARIDDTQTAIAVALQTAGYSTQSLAAVGLGVPDLLVGFAGCNILLEVKNRDGLDGKVRRGKGMTEDQIKWHARWRGQVAVVHTPDEALEVCSAVLAREKFGV